MEKPIEERQGLRCLLQVLWPAFLMAAVTEGLFFSMIDPVELDLVGVHLDVGREAAYTIGFFVFWALFAVSNSLTFLLMRNCSLPGGQGRQSLH